jgi:hypothetical protein
MDVFNAGLLNSDRVGLKPITAVCFAKLGHLHLLIEIEPFFVPSSPYLINDGRLPAVSCNLTSLGSPSIRLSFFSQNIRSASYAI